MSKEIREQKELEVAAIKAKVDKSKSIVIVDYRGLTVLEDTAMRVELRKANVDYKVLKNRLVLRALEASGFKGLDKALEGPTAVAFSYDDPVAPAKIIAETATKTKKMAIKGGIIEGKVSDSAEINKLATIPAKPILIGQLLGMLTNPMRSLAVAFSKIAEQKNA